MIRIILIRHGETDWNRGRRIMGHEPIPLNEKGREQIQLLREHLSSVHFDAIYTSPVLRARESAELLQGSQGSPLLEAPELAEIDYGEWVGKTFDEVRVLPQFEAYHRRPSEVIIPEGETFHDVMARVKQFFTRIRAEHEDMTIAAVSHADVIKAALIQHLTLPLDEIHRFRIDNGSYSVVWLEGDLERVLMVNALPRLDDFFEKVSLFRKK